MDYSPNIDNSEVAKFNAMADFWWDTSGPCAPLHILNPARLMYIQRHSQLNGKSVLDLGCGAGILTESLAKKQAKVVGIDASQQIIAVASQHAVESNLEITYYASTIEEFMATHTMQFDLITCMELIEHVPDPEKLIADCAKILQPGGKLFISTLNRTPKAYAFAIIGAEYLLKILPKHTHEYKKFIKPAELALMCRNANLRLTDLTGLKFDPFTKTAKLDPSLSINYLAMAIKEN